MTGRIVVGGASGFIGRHLVGAFRADGEEVVTIGRGAGSDLGWDDVEGIRAAVDGAGLVLGLAGRSVNCRYNARNREIILRSRVDTTRVLGEAIAAAAAAPPLWVNASTATIYRHAEDRPQTESTGEIGEGFSVEVAKAWEAELFRLELPGTRRVALRTAITLGPGSLLEPMIRLARVGLGGAHLDGPWPSTARRRAAGTQHEFRARGGRQRFSWIHLDDVLGIVRFLREHPELDGPVNAVAPHPVDDRSFMAALRRVLGVPLGIPMPRWMLEPGAWLIRTETELLLKSRWVLPEKLLAAGYEFRHPDLEEALRASLVARTC